MFTNGLLKTLHAISGGVDAVPSMQSNMGCGIFPSLLGVLPMLFEDKMSWVKTHLTKTQISQLTPDDIIITDEFATGLSHMSYTLATRICTIWMKSLSVLRLLAYNAGDRDTAKIINDW